MYGSYIGDSIPSVEGLTVKEAKKEITDAGFTTKLAGGDSAPSEELKFKVQKQWPKAGETAEEGAAIKITVYGAPEYTRVPSIVGKPAAQAKSSLDNAGLKHSLYGGDAATKRSMSYKVQRQSPKSGEKVIKGSLVIAHVYGNFDKQAALAEKTCKNFPGTTIQWDDEKDTAWCVCPSGQVFNKEKNRCITDPRIAERKNNQRNFWNAVINTAIPIIANEIASGGGQPSGGSTGVSSNGSSAGSSTGGSGSSYGGGGSSSSNGGTTKNGGDPDECEIKFCPSCAKAGIDLFKVATNDQCNECREKKSDEISKCIRGEKTGQGTKYAPKDYYVTLCTKSWSKLEKRYICKWPYTHNIYHKSKYTPNPKVKVYGPDTHDNCYNYWIKAARAEKRREGN